MCSAGASFLRVPSASRSAASLRRTAASIVSLAACCPNTTGEQPQRSTSIRSKLLIDLSLFVDTTSLLRGFDRLFDDFKAGLDFHLRSQRCRNATVFCVGEFDCVGNSCRRNRSAGEDVMYVHRRETTWIIVATLSGNFNGVARHVLSLLFENARNVGRRTRAKRHEQQLNRRSC